MFDVSPMDPKPPKSAKDDCKQCRILSAVASFGLAGYVSYVYAKNKKNYVGVRRGAYGLTCWLLGSVFAAVGCAAAFEIGPLARVTGTNAARRET